MTAIFTLLLELEDNTLYKRNCISSPVLFSAFLNLIIFFGIFYYQHVLILLLCGILIILKGFSYLGIVNIKLLNNITNLNAHSFLVAVMCASANIELENELFIFLGFYFVFFLTAPILSSSKKFDPKNNEFLTVLLELNRILAGIFMFIVGLVIATNNIMFLEKIANKLF